MPKYYPKSQITNNLHTNGHELMVSDTGKEYIGKYYKLSTGEMFVGTNPTSIQIKLIPLTDTHQIKNPRVKELQFTFNPQSKEYNKLKFGNKIPKPLILPSPSTTQSPLSKNGEYIRYFAKKNNNNVYMEISKDMYEKILDKDTAVDSTLYSILKLSWNINNNETNKNIVKLTEKKNNWVGFYDYLSNQLEDTQTKGFLYTRGSEFLLPNRTSYVGYYHYMSNGTPMVGKTHGEGKGISLIPLNIPKQPSQELPLPPLNSTPNSTGPDTISPGYSPSDSTWEY